MKIRRTFKCIAICLLLIVVMAAWPENALAQDLPADVQIPTGTGFTFRGELSNAAGPVTGACDFQFSLWDASAGGTQIGSLQTVPNHAVSNGRFTIFLNGSGEFGATAFNGEARWLQIAVRCPAGSGVFSSLAPRPYLSPAPYALYASNGGNAHTHLGQTWTGTGTPQVWQGSFGSAVQIVSNGSGSGFYVADVSSSGLVIHHAAIHGIEIHDADTDGVSITNADHDGIFIQKAGRDGVRVTSAANNGLLIGTAGNDAIYIDRAGSPSSKVASESVNGIEIAGATGAGVFVGRADQDGVVVHDAGNQGVVIHKSGDDAIAITNAGHDGVYVQNAGRDGIFVRAATRLAGYFGGTVAVTGDLTVSGKLTKGSGSFKIDHPLYPEEMYLSHSFVESPDMMNIYNGNVMLDASGTAWVELPIWFEALNAEFRYQLTPIGTPGPDLHIATPISGNRFQIGGGAPGQVVSWQVTGIRHDPFAMAHPIVVEEMKAPGEQGLYLHPTEWGQPASKGLIEGIYTEQEEP